MTGAGSRIESTSDFSHGGFMLGGFAAWEEAGGAWVPPQTLFLLNTLPAEPGAVYRWDDGAVWDDGLFWVEN